MIKINKRRLNEFMKFRRWRKTDLAKSMDFSDSYITRILNGDREPSAEFIERLHILTGLPLDEIFFCTKNPINGIKSNKN